jgi:ATP-dependent DNA helicase RecG
MTVVEIEELIRGGESARLEFKASTGQLRRGAETLCAFLNADGGQVVFGVTPTGDVVGQRVSDNTLRDVAAALQRFDPPAPVSMERVSLGRSDHELLVLTASSTDAPRVFTYDGRPYQRVGTTTSVMPQERYQGLLLERAHARQRWENAVTDEESGALDSEEVLRTVRIGVAAGRLPESLVGVDEALDRFGLRIGTKLTNAAIVLFGKTFLPNYPQCQLRMARFRGPTKSEFLDQRQVHGHAFQLLDEAIHFLSRHLPVAGRIQPGIFERVDEPLFPTEALREALVNAFCHRDYSLAGGAVSLAIYDDRLEIWSDGTLPFGLTVSDLKRNHLSRPRNPLISEVFYKRGLVERWGRGTQKIVELCVQAGHPEPEFVEQAGAVGVLFYPSGYIAPHRVEHDLTARQREILLFLSRTGSAKFGQIWDHLGRSIGERTLRDDLLHLKRLGLVTSAGRGRGALWNLASGSAGQ